MVDKICSFTCNYKIAFIRWDPLLIACTAAYLVDHRGCIYYSNCAVACTILSALNTGHFSSSLPFTSLVSLLLRAKVYVLSDQTKVTESPGGTDWSTTYRSSQSTALDHSSDLLFDRHKSLPADDVQFLLSRRRNCSRGVGPETSTRCLYPAGLCVCVCVCLSSHVTCVI